MASNIFPATKLANISVPTVWRGNLILGKPGNFERVPSYESYAGISGHPEGSTPGQPTGMSGDL